MCCARLRGMAASEAALTASKQRAQWQCAGDWGGEQRARATIPRLLGRNSAHQEQGSPVKQGMVASKPVRIVENIENVAPSYDRVMKKGA